MVHCVLSGAVTLCKWRVELFAQAVTLWIIIPVATSFVVLPESYSSNKCYSCASHNL